MRLLLLIAVLIFVVAPSAAWGYTITPTPQGFYLALTASERVSVYCDEGFHSGSTRIADAEWDGVPKVLRFQPLSDAQGGNQLIVPPVSDRWQKLLFDGSPQTVVYIPPGTVYGGSGGGSGGVPVPLPVTISEEVPVRVGNFPEVQETTGTVAVALVGESSEVLTGVAAGVVLLVAAAGVLTARAVTR